MLERYMAMAALLSGECDSFLFRGITQTKNGSKLREKRGLSYTTVREAVLGKLEAIGLDKGKSGSGAKYTFFDTSITMPTQSI